MSFVTMIDRDGRTVQVRSDMLDRYEICPRCNGNPYRTVHVGQSYRGGAFQGGWDMYETYAICGCNGGIRLKALKTEPSED